MSASGRAVRMRAALTITHMLVATPHSSTSLYPPSERTCASFSDPNVGLSMTVHVSERSLRLPWISQP